ncbi:hypothetical protein DERP_005989 [Dermatophagoides pteronyssinus]|uniref:Uncharacterized protein n=1 Tax=Dermatophagoides pteronyssinus TaxID=6956 RepID=A0ABQ8JSZ2_DERPT|nr:hypothetical protein DERP_005989 [Dermatophagoides pteronyssinus]
MIDDKRKTIAHKQQTIRKFENSKLGYADQQLVKKNSRLISRKKRCNPFIIISSSILLAKGNFEKSNDRLASNGRLAFFSRILRSCIS